MIHAFQVLHTGPLKNRNLGGYPKGHKLKSMLPDYYLLTMVLSVVRYKYLYPDDNIKLYCDENIYRYFNQVYLVSLWDQVDFKTIDHQIDFNRFDSGFYSVGKFVAYQLEPCPCMQIDVDLILWDKVDKIIENKAVAFTHWETTHPETEYYCNKDKLNTPRGYRFGESWNYGLMAANTSFVYINDDQLKNRYAEQAMRFMESNIIKENHQVTRPELLFADQRLLPILADSLGLNNKMAQLLSCIWGSAEGRFLNEDKRYGSWDYYSIDHQPLITHTWIAKPYIERNTFFKQYFCCKLLTEILSIRPDLETTLRNVSNLTGCFQLLDTKSLEELVTEGTVSRQLYNSQ